ncbi:MAG: helix-turn-helix transcriptional regulator [Selenomonadaceae bacterium]|nr:helix-turn-helix transcriptional regulator [Selenomonadaceae bacterium]
MKKLHDKDTDKLFSELKTDDDIEKFLSSNREEFTISLSEYLSKLLESKNLSKAEVVRDSKIERTYAYHIFNGNKKPSRTKLLAIARAMKLDLDETQYLLRYAGQALLYPRNTWDAVIILSIEKDLSVEDINSMLEQLGENQLLG